MKAKTNKESLIGQWRTSAFKIGLPIVSLLLALSTRAQDCTPAWGDWEMDTSPTLTDSCPSVSDQCVSVTTSGAYGGPVSASVTVTPTDGTKIQYDNNDCEDPNYQTAACSLSSPTTTWTASGCGANPSSGSGATATFKVNAIGSVSVSFSTTATDCFGGTYSASAGVSFNVLLNVTTPCVNNAPTPDPNVTINAGGSVSGTGFDYYLGGYTEYAYSGTVSPIQASYSYVHDRDCVSSCGPSTPLPQSETLPDVSFGADVGIPLGEVLDLGLSVDYAPAQFSFGVFGSCTSPPPNNIREYGTTWFRKGTPIPPTFTGSVTPTYCHISGGGLGDMICTPGATQHYNNQTAEFIHASEDYFEDAIASVCCSVACCPNN